MAALPPALRELIGSGPLTHLSTINADGSPQVSVIWIGLDGDDIVSGHLDQRQKLRNVRRDPRVVLSLEAPNINDFGLREYLVVHATARVEEGNAADLLQQLARVYLGPNVIFPPPLEARPGGYILRITPQRIGGIGPWTGG